MSGTYERIWLQCPNTDPENESCGETTWCQDKINDEDVEYVRGDLVESLRQRVKELEKTLSEEYDKREALDEELAALKAGQGEPVAYGLVMPSGQIDFDLIGTLEDCKFWSRAKSERQSGWKIAALYTAPKHTGRVCDGAD